MINQYPPLVTGCNYSASFRADKTLEKQIVPILELELVAFLSLELGFPLENNFPIAMLSALEEIKVFDRIHDNLLHLLRVQNPKPGLP